jgi:peptidoglycan hydrolase CwlO-like protein
MRRSSPTRFALAALTGLCCGTLVLAPAFAGGVSDQEKTVQQVVAEIDRMHQQVDQYNEDIVVALDQKTQLDAQIVVSQQKIAEQQAQLAVLEEQLGNVAVAKVMGSGSGALGPLFSDPVALDESLQRDHLARVAVDAGAATTNDYEVLLSQMQDEQKSLEENQAQAAALAEQAEASRTKAEQALKDLEAREAEERAGAGQAR